MASLLITILSSYLGGRLGSSKPRWIAGGMLTMALGSLVWTIPHFATVHFSALQPNAGIKLQYSTVHCSAVQYSP